jgi:hypothetical protein
MGLIEGQETKAITAITVVLLMASRATLSSMKYLCD